MGEINWNDVEDRAKYYKEIRYVKYYRQKILEGIYKNSIVEIYRVTSERYHPTMQKTTKIAAVQYSFSVVTNGERALNEQGKGYMLLPNTIKKNTVKREVETLVLKNWYIYSGDKKFDEDKKINIEKEDTLTKEILKNFALYYKYFNYNLSSDNVGNIVEKCVTYNDLFKEVFEANNTYQDSCRKYEKAFAEYQKLPYELRSRDMIVGTEMKTSWRRVHNYSSYWGIDEHISVPETTSENVYGPNNRYVPEPSDKELREKRNVYDKLVDNLKNKINK